MPFRQRRPLDAGHLGVGEQGRFSRFGFVLDAAGEESVEQAGQLRDEGRRAVARRGRKCLLKACSHSCRAGFKRSSAVFERSSFTRSIRWPKLMSARTESVRRF